MLKTTSKKTLSCFFYRVGATIVAFKNYAAGSTVTPSISAASKDKKGNFSKKYLVLNYFMHF